MDSLSPIPSSSECSNLITPETVPLRIDHLLYTTGPVKNGTSTKIVIVNPDGTTKELSCGIAFLEMTMGDQVSHAHAVHFQELAHSIWNLIQQIQPNKLPGTWGKAGLNIIICSAEKLGTNVTNSLVNSSSKKTSAILYLHLLCL